MSTDKMLILCSLMFLQGQAGKPEVPVWKNPGCATIQGWKNGGFRQDPSVPHKCTNVTACQALLKERGDSSWANYNGWGNWYEEVAKAANNPAAPATGYTGGCGTGYTGRGTSSPEPSSYSPPASPEFSEPVVQPDAVLHEAPAAATSSRNAPARPSPAKPSAQATPPNAPAFPRPPSNASETAAATTPSVEAAPGKPRTSKRQRRQAKRDADAENYRKTIAKEAAAAEQLRQTQHAKAKKMQASAQKLQTERANKVAENREKLARKGIAPRGRGPNKARRSAPPSPKEVKEPKKIHYSLLSSKQIDQAKRLRALGKEVGKRKRAGQANANRRRFPAAKRAKPSPNRSTN